MGVSTGKVQPQKEPPSNSVETTPWKSVLVAAGCGFVQAFQFSVFFTSMWPYLKQLDSSSSETFFGIVVSCYSLAQCIASPFFGFWSNRVEQVRAPMYTGLTCMFVGNVIYLTLDFLPIGWVKWTMLVGRFITGFGSGNLSLLRAYVATASTSKDRAKAIALVTGGIAFGLAVGPSFQLVFAPLGWSGWHIVGGFRIHMYNSPALLACIADAVGVLVLTLIFHEKYAGLKTQGETKDSKDDSPSYNIIGLIVANATRFAQMFVFTNMETIGSPFSMLMFDFTKEQAVAYNAIAQGVMGGISFIVYVLFIAFDLARFIHMRAACIVGLLLLAAFHAITYPWSFYGGHLTMYTDADVLATTNSSTELVGCNVDTFSWCRAVSKVNVWLFYASYVLCIGFAFPILNICATTIYSKLIGSRRQGTLQGIFQASGSAARLTGPVAMSALYSAYGPRLSWIMEVAVILSTLCAWAFCFRHMAPPNTAAASHKEAVEEDSQLSFCSDSDTFAYAPTLVTIADEEKPRRTTPEE